MSKRYTPEEKASILQTLSENCGNIQHTSQQTGIPSRTLYTWWKEEQTKLPQLPQEKIELSPPPLQQTFSFPDDREFEEALRAEANKADAIIDRVLDQLLQQAEVLSQRLTYNFDKAPPVSQMMALTRLIDRIIKLDARKPRLQSKSKAYIIRYKYPDGTIHKAPPWFGGENEDDYDPLPWQRKSRLQMQGDEADN